VHKLRNVADKLPGDLAATVMKKMRAAYQAPSAIIAEAQLQALARELEHTHPGSARRPERDVDRAAPGWCATHPGPHAPQHQQHRIDDLFSELENVHFVGTEPEIASLALVIVCFDVIGVDGAAGGLGETGYAQVHGRVAAGGDLVHLGKLVAGAGQADFQAFGFAEPTVGLGFGDAGLEVVEDLGEAATLVGVGSQ
jgi:hypothetical protein